MSTSGTTTKGSNSSVAKSYRKAPQSTVSRSKVLASKLSVSSSKRKAAGQAAQAVVPRILVNDRDVTPKSLLPSAKGREVAPSQNRSASLKSTTGSGRENADSSGHVGGDPFMSAWSQSEVAVKGEGAGMSSMVGGTGLGGTGSGVDSMGRESEDDLMDDGLSGSEMERAKSVSVGVDSGPSDAAVTELAPSMASEASRSADPKELLPVTLVESDTRIIFYRIGTSISTDDPVSTSVQEINAGYEKLKDSKASSDLFTSHHSQTDGFPTKTVKIGVAPPTTKETGVQASNWDIYDTFKEDDEDDGVEEEGLVLAPPTGSAPTASASASSGGKKASSSLSEGTGAMQREVQESISCILASGGCLLKVDSYRTSTPSSSSSSEPTEAPSDGKEALQVRRRDEILGSRSLGKALSVVESLLSQSTLFDKHLLYRDSSGWDAIPSAPAPSFLAAPAPTESSEDTPPSLPGAQNSLEKLWTFSMPELRDADVVEMKWNPLFPDMLVVGYGQIEFTVKKAGFVMFWSLKNPSYPMKQYHLPVGVSSLDFSKTRPHLLAVATYTGSIRIYDVRSESEEPVLTNTDLAGKHSEAIWKIKWVWMDQEKGEVLISISSDGKVKEWSMKRGLTSRDLMTLKRVPNPNGCSWRPKESSGESLLARISGGSTFDFAPCDSSTYIVGTENGTIHKCSCSYNEQYLQTYVGHSAPVYELQYNPFDENVFLSCSSDSTIKVWDMKQPQPLLNIQSPDTSQAIHHVTWHPLSSTVFASCTKEGRLEIWDLAQSTLNPIITDYAPYKSLDLSSAMEETRRHSIMKVLFGQSAPILVAGDESGSVHVYRIHSSIQEYTREKQLDRLNKATHPDAVLLH